MAEQGQVMAGRRTKRRIGQAGGGAAVADPRPRLIDSGVTGSRCTRCDFAAAQLVPWCAVCRSQVEPTVFAPEGTVWSATTVHIPVGTWAAPFGIAYLDLTDGPRVLAHLTVPTVAVGTTVRIVGETDGALLAEPIDSGGSQA